MRLSLVLAAITVLVAPSAFADDEQKAEKQIRIMTAMSRDDTARSIISRAFADEFKIHRSDMVGQRRALGLSYGNFFVARELLQSGAAMDQIVAQLRSRKSMLEIGNSLHANWKRIADDSKKMNNRINDGIYKHFLHSKPDEERDKVEHYNPSADRVRADGDVTNDEILNAQREFIFWRDQAAPLSGGQADGRTPVGRAYEQTRDNIGITHGDTPPGSLR